MTLASLLRRRARLRVALTALGPLLLALSCSDGDEETPPPPPGPVAVALGELRPRGSDTWKPGDAEPVVVGCDGRLGVTVFVYVPGTNPDPDGMGHLDGDWLFRPPDACGREQCGTLFVSVEPLDGGPAATGEAALDTVVVDLAPLGAAFEGRLRVRAELRENGKTPAVRNGVPLADELEISVVPEDCSPSGEGGAGGVPGTGGTGNQGGESGSPSTGGTAGTTGGAAGASGEGGAGGV